MIIVQLLYNEKQGLSGSQRAWLLESHGDDE